MDDRDPVFFRTTAGEVMHTLLLTCEPETPLVDVAQRMATHGVHCVLVMGDADDASRSPWAIVSDLDLMAAAAIGLYGRVARDIAATPVVTLAPGEPLWRAAQVMSEHSNPHLIVADPTSHRPLGIISTLDIARVAGTAPDTSAVPAAATAQQHEGGR
jgi:CBS domain-containing protein